MIASHKAHNPKFQVLNIATPRQQLLPDQCQSLGSEVTDVVSVFYGSDHFCVCHLNVKNSTIYVYDGLNYSLETWKDHSIALLKQCKFINLDCSNTFGWTTGMRSMILDGTSGNWVMRPGLTTHQQTNPYDCGPLACLQIMCIFGRIQDMPKLNTLT